MTTDETVHRDVAAYALGVLDPHETAQFEQHLADCARCAAELEALLPTVAALSEVDIDLLEAAERARMEEALWRRVTAERAKVTRRRALVLAAGVAIGALAAGGSVIAGTRSGDDTPPVAGPGPSPRTGPSPSPTVDAPGIGGPELPTGDRFSASDEDTGVQADLVLTEGPWGTQVSFALSGVTGPRTCRLLVVREDGTAEVAGTWRVPEAGYGTQAHPEPLLLQTATAVSQSEIDRIQVQSVAEDGEITTLVTVPLRR
jgi:copper chaperone CopZ